MLPNISEYFYRAFSHGVTTAILFFKNNETAAMSVHQANPVGSNCVCACHVSGKVL